MDGPSGSNGSISNSFHAPVPSVERTSCTHPMAALYPSPAYVTVAVQIGKSLANDGLASASGFVLGSTATPTHPEAPRSRKSSRTGVTLARRRPSVRKRWFRNCARSRGATMSRSPGDFALRGINEYDVANQGLVSHHYTAIGDRFERRSIPFRYVWPPELDLMARLAGMTLRERWSSWKREPFRARAPSTSRSGKYPLDARRARSAPSEQARTTARRSFFGTIDASKDSWPALGRTSLLPGRRYARTRDSEGGRARWKLSTVEPFCAALHLPPAPWPLRWIRSVWSAQRPPRGRFSGSSDQSPTCATAWSGSGCLWASSTAPSMTPSRGRS